MNTGSHSNDTRKAIIKLEKMLLEYKTRIDETFLRGVLADEFTEIGVSGRIYDKEETIKTLTASRSAGPFEFDITEFALTENPDGTVTAFYKVEINGTVTLRKSVWKRSETSWRIISHEGKPLENFQK